MSPAEDIQAPPEAAPAMRRALATATVGNLLEFYDFTIYAYLATFIAARFFPSADKLSSLLATFATLGVGYLSRPLGAWVIGRLADTRGRKTALVLALTIMALSTAGMGLIPDHQAIGPTATVLLVALRLLQGFSAGGQWGGATTFVVEWAPAHRRGLFGSIAQAGVAGGALFGAGAAALATSLVPAADMLVWGWRIPFLLGVLVLPVGYYVHRAIPESPAFRDIRAGAPAEQGATRRAPLFLKAVGLLLMSTVCINITTVYMPSFVQKFVGVTAAGALWSNVLGSLLIIALVPLAGLLSDRVGRRPVLMTSGLIFGLLSYPLFHLMLAYPGLTTVIAVQLAFAAGAALSYGALPTALAEMFPARMRGGGLSISYGLTVAVFGGFSPYVATWLIQRTGSPIAPAYFLIASAAVSLLAIVLSRETAHEALS